MTDERSRVATDFILPLHHSSLLMNAQHSRKGECAPHGTKQRISACRKRLRRTRATQRVLRIEQDEAVLAARSLLASIAEGPDASDSLDVFEEAGAFPTGTSRRVTLPS